MDTEGYIKLGDFGLATTDKSRDMDTPLPFGSHEKSRNSSNGGTTDALLAAQLSCSSNHSESLTGGVGTAMYRAPEQEGTMTKVTTRQGSGYDEKADLYSVGIVLYEMCHKPFATGMERLMTLRKLREELLLQKDESFNSSESLDSIILWLLQEKPADRPSASQLLSSSLLPSRMDTDELYLKEITRTLWKPKSIAAANILSVLFENSFQMTVTDSLEEVSRPVKNDTAIDTLTYDAKMLQKLFLLLQPRQLLSRGSTDPWDLVDSGKQQKIKDRVSELPRVINNLSLLVSMKETIRTLLTLNGAIEFIPSPIQLRATQLLSYSRNSDKDNGLLSDLVSFLDTGGQIITLPTDLISPFARYAAFLNINSSRRYQFGRVFCQSQDMSDSNSNSYYLSTESEHPKMHEVVSYDLILPDRSRDSVKVGYEIVVTVVKSVKSYASYLPNLIVRLTSGRILENMIEICVLPDWLLLVQQEKNHNKKDTITFTNYYNTIISTECMKVIRTIFSDSFLTIVESHEIRKKLKNVNVSEKFIDRLLPFLEVCSQLRIVKYSTDYPVVDVLNRLNEVIVTILVHSSCVVYLILCNCNYVTVTVIITVIVTITVP